MLLESLVVCFGNGINTRENFSVSLNSNMPNTLAFGQLILHEGTEVSQVCLSTCQKCLVLTRGLFRKRIQLKG